MKKIKLILLLTLIMYSCKQKVGESSKEQNINRTEEPVTVEREGLNINYAICGEGDTTLLFVHGWCIDQTYWGSQVEAFCPKYKVVTIDLAGHGLSGKNRNSWSIIDYAKDIEVVIKQLKLENVVLIGHSMGGNIILETALLNPEIITLIGIDNFKEVGIEYTEEMKAGYMDFFGLMKENYKEVVESFASSVLFHSSTDSSVMKRVIDDFTTSDPTIAINTLESLFEFAQLETEKLSEVKRPLYLINSNFTSTDIEGLESTSVEFKLVEIDSTGHYPMVEKPDTFNILLMNILEEM